MAWDGRRMDVAHRLAWELTHGPIPPGQFVCHTCDNPPCVNPAHLFLGSAADNSADMVAKGRQAPAEKTARRGESHGRALLTAAEVAEIRSRYAAGGTTYRQLASEYGVGPPHVWAIVNRRVWRD
jgi:hypothetical protein